MASKVERKIKSKARKTLKKTHTGYIVIAVIALIAGLAVGYFGASVMLGGDTFELVGDKVISVSEGEQIVYTDEGVKYISFGEDLSDKIEIKTNMAVDGSGRYTGVANADEEFFIIYTVTAGRCEGMTLYRVFEVKTGEVS